MTRPNVWKAIIGTLVLASSTAAADCATDERGEVFCGAGKCAENNRGQIYCSSEIGGTAVVTVVAWFAASSNVNVHPLNTAKACC